MNTIRPIRSLVVPIVLAIALVGGCDSKQPASNPTASRVVIVSIDGLRPDVMLRANMPQIRALMRVGSFTLWARTTEVSITLPSHVSMLTGVVPDRHGIWWNTDPPKQAIHSPYVPTIFELAKKRGLITALAVGKSKFDVLDKPGTLDAAYFPDDYANALQVAERAVEFIKTRKPDLLFVHFPDVDAAGHGSGWGSVAQIEAAEGCDRALGLVLAALRSAKLYETTAIILTADHGGAGHSHGAEDPRSRHIPWIISGPGIKQNLDLTTLGDLAVNTEDTFATACYLLHIPVDEDSDGKPILQVLESIKEPEGELMYSASPSATTKPLADAGAGKSPTNHLPFRPK